MKDQRAAEDDRNRAVRKLMVREHRSQDPIFPGAMHELPDLQFVAVESMLAAMKILQKEPLEITEVIEDECGHLAGDTLLFPCLFPSHLFGVRS